MTRVRPWVLVAGALLVAAMPARAQESSGTSTTDTLVLRALDLEESKPKEALVLYRRAFAGESMLPALLGLERVYTNLGMVDSLLPLIRSAIRTEPRSGVVRSVQLRTLTVLQRDEDLTNAFRDWVRAVPGEGRAVQGVRANPARVGTVAGRGLGADRGVAHGA